jgi:phenylalanyl-tRNA synthetase beta chain
MRVPLSWLREYAPVDAPPRTIADALIRAGLEVETVEEVGAGVRGVVVGEVLDVEELTGFKKPIRYVRVSSGTGEREVVCGATNFAVGDRVALAVPGAVLPGDFVITARETYGRTSDGMICSARELGLGDDHTGILVLDPELALGADVVEALGLHDHVLDIAVTPDRGYCLSVRGVAREAAVAFGVDFDDPGEAVDALVGDGHPVAVADTDACTRYVARVVRGVDPLAPSPTWLQRRVALAGMRPISLAVDVTNYVMQAVGQPLHAFDLARVAGGIVVRRAVVGERLTTLDEVDRGLTTEDLLITDSTGPIALAGVMGGAATEIGDATSDVLVEAAHFNAVTVGRGSRRHNLVSEASKRFERGVDPDLAPAAAQLAVALLTSLGGGTPDAGATDVDNRRPRPVIALARAAVTRRGGRDYADDVVRLRLEQVGCAVTGADDLEVVPPSWRPDLTEAVDLTEEVIRLEGYDTLPSVLPSAPAGQGLTPVQRTRRRIGRALASAGYCEVTPYPFMSEAVLDDLGLGADDERRRTRRIANPVADTEPVLCTTLLPGLLASLQRNVGRGLADASLFQLAPVFLARPSSPAAPRTSIGARPSEDALRALDAALPDQPWHVGVVVCGARERGGWWGGGRPAEWSDAVEAARTVARAIGTSVTAVAAELAPWHPGRCAQLLVGDTVVGHAGELHPRVCDRLGLPARTCAAELDLTLLLSWADHVVQVPELSTFPPATVDVALTVDAGTPAAAVEASLRAGAGESLEDLRLFDVYTGPQVGEGRKSLAYALRFRATDRTLTDAEVNAMRDAAVATATERTGAVLRGA